MTAGRVRFSCAMLAVIAALVLTAELVRDPAPRLLRPPPPEFPVGPEFP